ncbi:peptide deformylase [Luteococcus sp. Sow4_B9]|uniref:peptide deformylase n=1 Tax=Luteococcus sp. Sow4_B9 TaxID=3438792 RepID=UPI003F94D2C0
MSAKSLEELATGGKVRRITRWGEPVLHAPTRPVTSFDDDLHELIRDMFATMEASQGVGLAATQVGVDLALFVYDCPDEDLRNQVGVFCNPTVSTPDGRERKLDATEEGCLSWPGGYQPVARPDRAICTGQDAFGNEIAVEGTGLLARCLQHETDHLSGMVFGDRLSKRSRRKLDEQVEQLAHLYPDDWPITPKGRHGEA